MKHLVELLIIIISCNFFNGCGSKDKLSGDEKADKVSLLSAKTYHMLLLYLTYNEDEQYIDSAWNYIEQIKKYDVDRYNECKLNLFLRMNNYDSAQMVLEEAKRGSGISYNFKRDKSWENLLSKRIEFGKLYYADKKTQADSLAKVIITLCDEYFKNNPKAYYKIKHGNLSQLQLDQAFDHDIFFTKALYTKYLYGENEFEKLLKELSEDDDESINHDKVDFLVYMLGLSNHIKKWYDFMFISTALQVSFYQMTDGGSFQIPDSGALPDSVQQNSDAIEMRE